jgi:hypothetical protein
MTRSQALRGLQNNGRVLYLRTLGSVYLYNSQLCYFTKLSQYQIMRGLMFRSDNRAYQGISKIVDLFADADINHDAARTMLILSMEKDGVITKSNHAVIRVRIFLDFREPELMLCAFQLLYKQRFYSFIMPKLIQGYHSAGASSTCQDKRKLIPSASESGKGTAYLIGLSCLLQNMPKQTTVAELPKVGTATRYLRLLNAKYNAHTAVTATSESLGSSGVRPEG